MAPAAAVIPALIGAGGSVAGSVIAGKAAKSASKASPEEQAYLAKQGQLADLLRGQAEQSYNTGMPRVQQAMDWYDTLAHGNRARMAQMLAPSTAQITDQYRGGADAIMRGTTRGGVRDLALAELDRDKTNKLSLLTTGQQAGAIDSLNSTGMSLLNAASGGAANAGDILRGMTGNAELRRQYGAGVGADVGKSMGGMIADILKQQQSKPKKGPGPTPYIPGAPVPWNPGSGTVPGW